MALTFSKLQTAKDVGRQKSKKPPFRPFLESQHVKASKQCQNLHQRKFSFIFFSLLLGKLSWKISLLLICQILGLFVNTLTVDDKDSLCNSANLLQPIQTQLSLTKNFVWTFCPISEIYIKFWTFWKKKMILGAYVFPKGVVS